MALTQYIVSRGTIEDEDLEGMVFADEALATAYEGTLEDSDTVIDTL